jgi:hypothetical protein
VTGRLAIKQSAKCSIGISTSIRWLSRPPTSTSGTACSGFGPQVQSLQAAVRGAQSPLGSTSNPHQDPDQRKEGTSAAVVMAAVLALRRHVQFLTYVSSSGNPNSLVLGRLPVALPELRAQLVPLSNPHPIPFPRLGCDFQVKGTLGSCLILAEGMRLGPFNRCFGCCSLGRCSATSAPSPRGTAPTWTSWRLGSSLKAFSSSRSPRAGEYRVATGQRTLKRAKQVCASTGFTEAKIWHFLGSAARQRLFGNSR